MIIDFAKLDIPDGIRFALAFNAHAREAKIIVSRTEDAFPYVERVFDPITLGAAYDPTAIIGDAIRESANAIASALLEAVANASPPPTPPAPKAMTPHLTLEEYHHLMMLVSLGKITRACCTAADEAQVERLQDAMQTTVYISETLRTELGGTEAEKALFTKIDELAVATFGDALKVRAVEQKKSAIVQPTGNEVTHLAKHRFN